MSRLSVPVLLVVGAAAALAALPVHAQQGLVCDASYGEAQFTIGRHATSSNWLQLTNQVADVAGVRVTITSGSGSGHQLKLANNWNPATVFQSIDLASTTPTQVAVAPRPGALIGFIAHASGSAGMSARVTACCRG